MKIKEMIPNSLKRLLIVKQILLIKNSMENMLIYVEVHMVAKSSLQEKLIAQGHLEITPFHGSNHRKATQMVWMLKNSNLEKKYVYIKNLILNLNCNQ